MLRVADGAVCSCVGGVVYRAPMADVRRRVPQAALGAVVQSGGFFSPGFRGERVVGSF